MKVMARKALILGVIGGIAALLLAVTNHFTQPIINEAGNNEFTQMLSVLAVQGTPGTMEANPAAGVAKRWPMEGGGWILELTAIGYGGPMTVAASYDSQGAVLVARLMENNETIGFGKKAEDPSYMDVFIGKGGDNPLPKTKNDLGDDVDVVSGATVTFSKITSALIAGSELVKEWEAP